MKNLLLSTRKFTESQTQLKVIYIIENERKRNQQYFGQQRGSKQPHYHSARE